MSSITPKPGITVEISMQGIEKSRLDAIEAAESLRKANEAERTEAELMRKEGEAGRITAEQERTMEEDARNLAESGRILAEESRVTAENLRSNGEQSRVESEEMRENAEADRVTAETARANAEALRQQTFETNEANRHTAFESAENARESEWTEIKSNVETSVGSAVASASAATDAANTAADNANAAAEKSVRYDVAQTLSDAQKAQARGNIDAADEESVDALKGDIANYTPLTNKKTLKYGDYNLKTGRVVKDGSIQSLSGFSYVTLDVQSIKSITMQINASGASDFGYCFYNADGSVNLFKATNYTKIETIEVPQGAMVFKYGQGESLWNDAEIVLETNEDKTYEILYNKLFDSERKIEDINNHQDNFYKKEISKTLSKDSDEVIETKNMVLLLDGTQSHTDVSGRNIYTVNNIEHYSTITFKTVNVMNYGLNASSYAWLDSEGAVLKAVRRLVDEIVTVPILENSKSIVIYSTDNFSDGCILTSADDLADIKNSVAETTQKISAIENLYVDENPLGYMDNLFIDKWNGIGIFKSDGGAIKNIINKIYENDVLVSFKVSIGYSTSINDDVIMQGTSFLRIKKSTSDRTINITLQSGAVCNFKDYDIEEGTILYQNYATNPVKFGEIVKVTDDYIIFYTDCINSYTITSKIETTNSELVIYPEYCGAFLDLVSADDINFDMQYKSRSMKINSPVRGKNAICFGDSLASWILPLAVDYGMNVFTVTGGGCRMGYEGGSGAGGETGTADALWLCSDTRIQRFNTNFADLTDVDYIINMTGTNGTLSDISSAEELKFISVNKRWWFDTSETNPFDSLSDEDKARFTSQACYMMAFIKLIKKYPRAIPVICSLYRYKSADGNTEDALINYLYNDERRQKNNVLKEMSNHFGGYFVDLERCGCNVMSDGGDAVHPDYRHSIMASSEIIKTIEHLDYVGDKFS